MRHSGIYVHCPIRKQNKIDIIVCFHRKCENLKRCKELGELREKIQEWYQTQETTTGSSQDRGQKKTKRMVVKRKKAGKI